MTAFPAARIVDPVTHDQLVPSGMIAAPPGTVLIERMMAATVTSTVACSGVISAGLAHPPPPGPPPLIVVGSATALILGKPSARWAPTDFAACSAFLGDIKLAVSRTVLIGGPTTVMVALANLKNLLLERKGQLEAWDPATQKEFEKWFGTTSDEARDKILQRIDDMLNLINGYSDSNFQGAEDDHDLYAWVDPSDDSTIHLGNGFATAPPTGQDSHAGIVGHEMSHFDSIGGTDDHVYGDGNAKNLAKTDPDKALENADNFEYFVEGVP